MRPDVGAVVGDEDGYIADDLHSLCSGMGAHGGPLPEEQELLEAASLHRLVQPRLSLLNGGALTPRQRGLPHRPRAPVVLLLQRHEQGEVLQPVSLPFLEGCEGCRQPGRRPG